MTTAERKQVVDAWMKAKPAKLSVIVHVGHLSLGDSCALARHAEACGANAFASVAPSFFKPGGVNELVDWCATVARAAPSLPFYYYHIPAMTGVTIPTVDFLAQARERIPNLAGIKFTHENLMDFGLVTEHARGKYEILFGRDEILLSGLALGAKAAVGSNYNFAAPLFNRIHAAFLAGEWETARGLQTRAMELIGLLRRHGGLAAGKAIMKLIGIDCGPVRLPLRALTPADEHILQAALQRAGFRDELSHSGSVLNSSIPRVSDPDRSRPL